MAVVYTKQDQVLTITVGNGVPIGSSVGTAYLNVEDIWNVLTSTMTTTGSIGERLKVASTIETTGDQLAAYLS